MPHQDESDEFEDVWQCDNCDLKANLEPVQRLQHIVACQGDTGQQSISGNLLSLIYLNFS